MMEYYESSPEAKGREKAVVAVLSVLGVLLFTVSRIPGMLFPVLWQLLAVLCLGLAIFLSSGCLLKKYDYAIAPRDDADAAPWDLTVTEICGKRRSVVARIALNEITSAKRVARKDRSAFVKELHTRRMFSYTGVLFSDSLVYISARVGGEAVFVEIAASDRLLNALSSRNSNNCPDNAYM